MTQTRFLSAAARKGRDAMAFALSVIAAFLSGLTTGIFAVLVAAIRRGDQARNLTGAPGTYTESATRRLLGVGVRNNLPCPGPDREL